MPLSTRLRYTPLAFIRSSWLPVSTTLPSSTTTITSMFLTVESRWAITTVVICDSKISLSRAACTAASLVASSAEVASSSSSTLRLESSARAIATRCFCPPLS
mmetsp:Transcript_41529/g.88403  ORF Transcript_41529/g.88403 Transcript_41529/m.88403 type:complete len:103 (-) Transcript_41529:72-380(-)